MHLDAKRPRRFGGATLHGRISAALGVAVTALSLCACTSADGNVAVSLSPADNSLSQSGVTCSQNGSQFSASGTLTNVTKSLVVFSSADLTLYDASGNELGTKDSALVSVQPGNSYNWQVSANVGSAQVGRCDMSFTAGPPPLGP